MFSTQYQLYIKKTGACPICQLTDKGCKVDLASKDRIVLCRKIGDYVEVPGYVSLGRTNNQTWRMFKEGSATVKISYEERKRNEIEQEERAKRHQEDHAKRMASLPSKLEKHNKILAKIKGNPLSPEHIKYLNEDRGLTDEEIKFGSFFDHSDGIAIPFKDIGGLYIGFQVKQLRPGKKGYKWGFFPGFNHLKETGELPIAVAGETDNPKEILLVEGIGFKLEYVAKHYPDCLVMGAASGNFAVSWRQFKDVLDRFPAAPIRLIPDGGSQKNTTVFPNYKRTHDRCKSEFDREVKVWWWGQLEKGNTDIDEIGLDTKIAIISFKEYEAFRDKGENLLVEAALLVSGFLKRSVAKFTQEKSVEDDSSIPSIERQPVDGYYRVYDESEYWGEQLVKNLNVGEYEDLINEGLAIGKKRFLDCSQAGMGKSTAAALIREVDGINRTVHLSNRSRNLTTEEANNSYVLVPARAEKLYRVVGRQTLPGKDDIVTTKPKGGVNYEELQGNCHYAPKFQALQSSGWDLEAQKEKLCGVCPFATECRMSEGNGYGYLYQMEQAMRQKRLVASLAFMYRLQNEDLSKTLLIFDDEKPIVSKSMFVTVDQIQATMTKLINSGDTQILTEFVPILARIIKYIKTPSRHGFAHFEMYEGVEFSDIAQLERKTIEICEPDFEKLRINGSSKDAFKEKMENHGAKYSGSWTPEEIVPNFASALLRIMSGSVKGASRVVGETLEVTIEDPTWAKIQEKAAAVLILDATASKKWLAQTIGCKEDEIFTVSQPVVDVPNQKTVHVSGTADFSRSREVDRMPAVVAAVKSKYNTDSVGVLDYKGFGTAGEDFTRGTSYSDNRGTNKFKGTEILVQAGLQVPCRGALAVEFAVMTGRHVDPSHKCEDLEFLEYVKDATEAEEIQSQNRQRAYRFPDKQFIRIVVSNREDICSEALRAACPGLTIEKMRMIDLCPEAAKKGERTIHKILTAITSISGANLRDIAVTCDLSESTVSHALSQFGGFRKTCEILYTLLSRKTQVSSQALQEFLTTESSLVKYTNQVLDDDLSTPTELATELDKLLCPLTSTQLDLLVATLSPVQARTATELTLLHALSTNSTILTGMKLSETGDSIEDLVEGLRSIAQRADVEGFELLRTSLLEDKESMHTAASIIKDKWENEYEILKDIAAVANKVKALRATRNLADSARSAK
jgi:hypothetical protein